jgi:ATP-dependent helicase/nuclease subunit A
VAPAPVPAVEGQHDTNATVTDVSEFAACPRRYYLGRYLGFEGRVRTPAGPAEGGALSAGEFGTQVHAILAGTPPADPDPEAVELAAVFHRSPLGRRVARARRVEREFDFLMAVGELVLRGQVDLFFEEGGELVLVDYKTDSVSAHEAHDRAVDYETQLRLYALAVERLTGRAPGHAFLHFLRTDTVIEVDVTPSLLDSPEQVVADLLDAQQALDFPLREGAHCCRCPFHRDLCPAR